MKIINKFRKLDDVAKSCFNYRKKRNKIVLCHGVFDLLHVGHIKHLLLMKRQVYHHFF